MPESLSKASFSFQAKVLIPVIALLTLLLAIIVWLVNGRITDQFEEETRRDLITAESVFRNFFEIRTRNLLLRYQNVVNEPRFKAVAQLNDPKTMTVQLNELIHEIGPELKGMTFSTRQAAMLAGARSDPDLDLTDFQARSRITISQALEGRPAVDIVTSRHLLLQAISIPVMIQDSLAGVLTIAQVIGPSAGKEFKSLTHGEIIFFSSGSVALSTLPDSSLPVGLEKMFNRLSTNSEKKVEAVAAGNEHFLSLAGTLPASSGRIGYLLLSSYEAALQKKKETQATLMLISLSGILFSSLLIWILIRKITRPLRQLRDSAEAVGRGDFSHQVEVNSRDECGELAKVFNRMTENLKTSQAEIQQAMQTLKDTQDQLIQTEKLSAMGEFVAGIAHELNNPLTGVIGFSQILADSGISEAQNIQLNRITESAERCRRIVQNLLSFSRRNRPERKPVDLNELLESAIEFLEHELTSSNIVVSTKLTPGLPMVRIDPHQMQQVFFNVIRNAKQAALDQPDGGRLCISTKLVSNQIQIRFEDNGVGIAAENLPNIFNPFFTTKPVGAGTGLGLSLSYGIIREHGGSIYAESQLGEGAIFTIELPVDPSF